jgi:ABC-2 type transport system ATP-binding protein
MSIRINQVSKQYRNSPTLSNINFASEGREAIAIVGVNGAGKTTLIRCLLDFTRPDEGSIHIAGIPNRYPGARGSIAYLPERFIAPPHLSGGETLKFLADLNGAELNPREVDQALARFEFPVAAIDKPVRHYSKGMIQKLGLVSTILSRKAWLVLDEPMSGLDPQGRLLVVKLINEARSSGQGVLFTTHALHDLENLCDRIVVMHQGRMIYQGTPKALLRRHDTADLEQAFLCEIAATADQGSGQ